MLAWSSSLVASGGIRVKPLVAATRLRMMEWKVSSGTMSLLAGSPPLLLAGPLMIGAFALSGPLSIVCLGLGGFMLLSTIPVIVAMAQELVPGQTSTVSALMMGAAWGVGALAPQALSNFVPAFGFRNVLIAASAVTTVTAVLAYFLPREEQHRSVVDSDLATAPAVGD